MLSRSVRRQKRHTSNILAASFAQLNLPWLAPAQLRWSASHAAPVANPHINSRPRRRSMSKACRQAKAQTRQLATAADTSSSQGPAQYEPPSVSANAFRNAAYDQNIPWDFSKDAKTKYSTLRPYSDPIILGRTIEPASEFRRLAAGAHGTTVDLLHLLYTTLRVGRISRAENIIHRLVDQLPSSAPEIVHAHTIYLEEMLRVLVLAGNGTGKGLEAMKHVQRWFEVEVLQKGIQPNGKLLVIMVKAAVCSLKDSQRDRAIRRYAEMARNVGENELDEVLYSELYDDNEFTIIGAATSEYYEELDETTPQLQAESANIDEIAEEHSAAIARPDAIRLEDIPGVRPTEQKGLGLSSVQQSLKAFSRLPALPTDASPEAQLSRAYERERLMEESSVEIAVERWRKDDEGLRKAGVSTTMQSKPVGALMYQWYKALYPVLEKEKEECRNVLSELTSKETDQLAYGPYLETLPTHKLAASTIISMITVLTRGKDRGSGIYEFETKLSAVITAISDNLEMESNMEAFRRSAGKRNIKARSEQALRHLMAKQRREQKTTKDVGYDAPTSQLKADWSGDLSTRSWPMHIKVKIGAMLLGKLMETAQIPVTREHPQTKDKITSVQPAFMHRPKYVRGKRIGMVVPNMGVIKKLENEPTGSLLAKRMPMIVEPLPWTGFKKGGYIHYPTPILRQQIGDKSGEDYFRAAHEKGDLNQLYAGLTALGRVSWKVHHGVLKAQVEAWNSGEAIANFAPLNPTMNLPPEPASNESEARRKWLRVIQSEDAKRAGLHSKRCFQNFQLELARGLANETLYFPHSLDFRGRAYPIPPYLNHMGADNVRGLLVFAEGKELGETGVRWLKIHLANVFGYDKASLQEREEFTMKHLDDIYDSVRNPFSGRRWWLKSEDAWQTLAACHEIVEAFDSPDPTKFVSHLPVHQDGTCNGLQHYAALGGDEAGAAQVNLAPSDRPADVYTGVLNAVNEKVDRDAAEGHPVAKRLQGRLTRKIVKRPVMTNVYGVTFYGAREQVKKELAEHFPDIKVLDEINPLTAAQYITKNIFESLGEMFKGAQAIQHWFGTCADRISTCMSPEQIAQLSQPGKPEVKTGRARLSPKARALLTKETNGSGTAADSRQTWRRAKPLFKSPVVWTTPLRLPVVQPYRTSSARVVKTSMQSITLQEPHVWDPISKRKQLQAFPPNFIHSLDATHMIISALKCNELGLSFASIHDSFWTHASDINKMNVVLRDAFVAMHSEDTIGRLREEFQTRYKDHFYLASISATSPAGKAIKQIRKEGKFLSNLGELQVEVERLRLINSEDPAEREKGEAMVTPGSFLANETDESLFLPAGPTPQPLGEVPESAEYEATNAEEDVLSHIKAPGDEALADEEAADDVPEGLRADSEAEDVDAGEEELGFSVKEKMRRSKATAESKKKWPRKVYVWMPMTFPEVPTKGTFDVRRLKESKYFFH